MLSSDFPRAERRIFLKKDTRKLITCIAVPLATGAVSGFFTRNGMKVFAKLNKPPLSPPGWLVPVVWTILFIMMGIASFLIASRPKSRDRDRVLALYGIQLAVNFLWPFFFFGAGWYGFAFLWLIFLWGLVYGCIRTFGKFSRNAAYLMIPYLAWLTFAGYLNLFIALWN